MGRKCISWVLKCFTILPDTSLTLSLWTGLSSLLSSLHLTVQAVSPTRPSSWRTPWSRACGSISMAGRSTFRSMLSSCVCQITSPSSRGPWTWVQSRKGLTTTTTGEWETKIQWGSENQTFFSLDHFTYKENKFYLYIKRSRLMDHSKTGHFRPFAVGTSKTFGFRMFNIWFKPYTQPGGPKMPANIFWCDHIIC